MLAQAALMREPHGHWSMETVTVAEPGPDEVRVRVLASGVCQTDMHARDGFFPMPCPAVYGHEGAGIVEKVGAGVTHVAPGDHVIMANPSCGACDDCRAGFETYCTNAARLKFSGLRADGRSVSFVCDGQPIHGSFFQQSSFAAVTLAMARSTIRVPHDAPLEVLAAIPCGVNAGAGAVLNVLEPKAGDSYVAFGIGTVGFAGMLAARLCGCEPIVAVDLFEDRLALARELGAHATVNAGDPDLVTKVRRLIGGRGARFCLEAAGSPQALRAAVEVLAPRGTACLVGSARPGAEVSLEMKTIQQGRIVRGCIQGESDVQRFLPRLIELFMSGKLPIDRLVRHYPHAAINEAAADMHAGRTIKAVLRMAH